MKKILTLILFCGLFFSLNAGEVSLNRIAEEPGVTIYWEPYRDMGIIAYRNRSVVFKPNIPWALGDYRDPIPVEISVGEGGEILFSSLSVSSIRGYLEDRPEDIEHRISTIVLDAGHGGRDPGAVGKHSFADDGEMYEKEITLDVARNIASLIQQRYPGKKVVFTREDDTYLTLEERTQVANNLPVEENKAVIFISIHVNASFRSSAKGFEVWFPPSEYRRDLLTEEEKAGLSDEVQPIINAMKEAEYAQESLYLADLISDGMNATIGGVSPNRGIKEEKWFVVRNSNMPAVLVEVGFISNPEEAARMLEAEYLMKVASGIYNGIEKFIDDFEASKGFTE